MRPCGRAHPFPRLVGLWCQSFGTTQIDCTSSACWGERNGGGIKERGVERESRRDRKILYVQRDKR